MIKGDGIYSKVSVKITLRPEKLGVQTSFPLFQTDVLKIQV